MTAQRTQFSPYSDLPELRKSRRASPQKNGHRERCPFVSRRAVYALLSGTTLSRGRDAARAIVAPLLHERRALLQRGAAPISGVVPYCRLVRERMLRDLFLGLGVIATPNRVNVERKRVRRHSHCRPSSLNTSRMAILSERGLPSILLAKTCSPRRGSDLRISTARLLKSGTTCALPAFMCSAGIVPELFASRSNSFPNCAVDGLARARRGEDQQFERTRSDMLFTVAQSRHKGGRARRRASRCDALHLLACRAARRDDLSSEPDFRPSEIARRRPVEHFLDATAQARPGLPRVLPNGAQKFARFSLHRSRLTFISPKSLHGAVERRAPLLPVLVITKLFELRMRLEQYCSAHASKGHGAGLRGEDARQRPTVTLAARTSIEIAPERHETRALPSPACGHRQGLFPCHRRPLPSSSSSSSYRREIPRVL